MVHPLLLLLVGPTGRAAGALLTSCGRSRPSFLEVATNPKKGGKNDPKKGGERSATSNKEGERRPIGKATPTQKLTPTSLLFWGCAEARGFPFLFLLVLLFPLLLGMVLLFLSSSFWVVLFGLFLLLVVLPSSSSFGWCCFLLFSSF